jgi:hypothetical protein
MHCRRFHPLPLTRRHMLLRCANGFGAVAASALFAADQVAAPGSETTPPGPVSPGATPARSPDPLAPKSPHFQPKARNVIFLFMDGGPSQVDTFDPKPRLDKEHGRPIGIDVPPTQFDDVGTVLKSPWAFHQYGESGIPVSDLFPHVARHVDELAVIRSMTSNFSEHTNANYFIHSGSGVQGRPSMGAWITYGLGNECRNLPGFVVLNQAMIPPGGLDCFGSGFLPATFQGSLFTGNEEPMADVRRTEPSLDRQIQKRNLVRDLNTRGLAGSRSSDALESAIANAELAFRMQTAVPELVDLSGETRETIEAYGIHQPHSAAFGRECLLARRMVERGVRFIELLCPSVGHDRWDQHNDLKGGHEKNAAAVDQPIGALLGDLRQRGLLDETLVVWAGEFGRTPMAQGSDGRDHNPFGFSLWMAGGGVKGGTIYGATDEYGYYAVQGKLQIHDLHATMLHLLGFDHTKLTFRFGGRDMRLTDVHGHVVHEILA